MKKYIKPDGSVVDILPDLDQFVQVDAGDLDMTVTHCFHVLLYEQDQCNMIGSTLVGEEHFHSYPTNEQIRWCLFKHKAHIAQVHKIYSLEL